MKKKLFGRRLHVPGVIVLLAMMGNCQFFKETGVCTYLDTGANEFVCVDEVTEKECDEMGGDFFIGEPCY